VEGGGAIMLTASVQIEDVERWNDAFALENDIDEYYERSGWAIRLVERRRLSIIRAMVAMQPGERILEVGCGGGHVLEMFAGARLTGVDVSEVFLTKARRRLAGLGATLLKGELPELGLADGSFDKVVCMEVLEHVVDPDGLIGQMARVVKPGGTVVVTLPNDRLIHRIKGLIRRSGLGAVPPFRRISWGADKYHLHAWSPGQMRAMLARHFAIACERFAPTRAVPIRCCFRCIARQRGRANGRAGR